MYLREVTQTRVALAGDTTLGIVTDMSDTEVVQLFEKLWRQIYVFESRFSRFLPKSELSAFNRSHGLKIKITPEFKSILVKAQKLATETKGLFNPFIVPALQRAGYLASAAEGYEKDPPVNYTDRKIVGVDRLVVGDDWAKIPYGTALDLGGCGKGYLADQLGEVLKNEPVMGFWVSLSGDVVTSGSDENGDKITLSIQSATSPAEDANWVVNCPMRYFGVATSGTFRRKSQVSAKTDWHHIIDPNTREPAKTDINLATVCASSVFKADILASCAVILGSQKAPSFLKKHGATGYLLQCSDEDGKPFDKVSGENIRKIKYFSAMEVLQNA